MSEPRTRQELFDLAYRGMAAQGWQISVSEDGLACLYRSEDGTRRCAIGYCIDDADYLPSMEGANIGDIRVRGPARIADEDVMWAINLQRLHDRRLRSQALQLSFEAFARQSGLSVPKILRSENV